MQIPKPQTSCYSLLFGVIVAHVLLSSFFIKLSQITISYSQISLAMI
jgi:hypothetical protein